MAKNRHTFTMKVSMENDAFFGEDGAFRPGHEMARILGNLAQRIQAMGDHPDCRYPILDENGNVVGEAKIT